MMEAAPSPFSVRGRWPSYPPCHRRVSCTPLCSCSRRWGGWQRVGRRPAPVHAAVRPTHVHGRRATGRGRRPGGRRGGRGGRCRHRPQRRVRQRLRTRGRDQPVRRGAALWARAACVWGARPRLFFGGVAQRTTRPARLPVAGPPFAARRARVRPRPRPARPRLQAPAADPTGAACTLRPVRQGPLWGPLTTGVTPAWACPTRPRCTSTCWAPCGCWWRAAPPTPSGLWMRR